VEERRRCEDELISKPIENDEWRRRKEKNRTKARSCWPG
jgi:hypothetical protein